MTTATISVLVQSAPDVVVRVTSLVRRRGVGIHSLAVGPTENLNISRITMVVDLPLDRTASFAKQLSKLVEVLRVKEVDGSPSVDRQLALIKINVTPGTRRDIMHVANAFRANIVDLTDGTMTLEVTGRGEKIDAIIELLRTYGIREAARSGQVTLARGARDT